MRSKTLTPLGSIHPILFMAAMYIVTLLFSIFICSSLFYSCNSSSVNTSVEKTIPVKDDKNSLALN